MHPNDADAHPAEGAPRKRPRRRRRSSSGKDPSPDDGGGVTDDGSPGEAEAAAFLEPPPLGGDGEDAARPTQARKKRTRRRRRTRDEEAEEQAAPPQEAAEAADETPEKPPRKKRARRKRAARAKPAAAAAEVVQDSAAEGDGAATGPETAEAGDDAPQRPRRKKAARKKAVRKKRARRTSAKTGASELPADEPPADDVSHDEETAPEDSAGAPAPAAAEHEDGGGEARPARKKRARRKRKRSRRKKSTDAEPADGAVAAEPDIDAPPPPAEDGADGPAEEAGGEASDSDAAPATPRGKRKRPKRARRKRSRKDGEGKDDERKEGERKEGERKGRERKGRDRKSRERKSGERKRRDGRKSDGRRGEGRKGEGGRGDRRQRDPRAIEIVPRAPTPEDLAREKVLLVNATDREEARIALLVDGVLEEVYVEAVSSERSSAGNIYRGRVQNVERGIGAAFVDLGRGVTGFLHASDLPMKEDDDASKDVTERLHPGDEVIVQITRDSIGRKGPALTGRISFAGRYLVLMPFTARSGISRRIPQGPERDRVRKLVRKLDVPEGMGVIVRTASETTDLAALEADLNHLLKEWEFIERKAAEPGQPGVLRGESDLAERSVRDIMPSDVARIIVDRDDIAGRIHRLLRVWYPSAAAAADEAAHAAVRSVSAAMDAPLGEIAHDTSEAPPPDAREPDESQSDELMADPVSPEEPDELAESIVAADDEAAGDDTAGDDTADDEAAGDDTAGDDTADDDTSDDEAASEAEHVDGEDDAPAEDRLADADEEPEAEPPETAAERLERLTELARAMPEVELHTDTLPLFHKYGAETQLEDAFRRSTRLPSGGSIVIDPTEALVAVDVNSGRLTDETDPESTALVTNLEAVQETARQLRLRDLGGLVVIDFIDMRDRKSRKKVETALREALSGDRARIRMGRMGPFGLVVLSRQRIRQALSRVTHDPCDSCGGTGYLRQISGLGLRVLREMQARVARSRGRGGLGVRAPQEVVSWVKKNRSGVLKQLKKACNGPITLEADARLAVDGWAMKGLPPDGAGADDE